MCCVNWTFTRICKDYSLEWEEKFLRLAQIEMDKQAYRKAISILNKLLKLYPSCSTGYKQRGLCWDHEEEPEKSVEDYKMAVQLATNPSQMHRYKSYLQLALKDYSEAYEEVNLALKLNLNDPANFHQHAYVLFKFSRSLGRSSQVQEMQDYEQVLKLGYNRMTVIYNNIGYVYYERGQYETALEYFNKSIELRPYHVRAYYNRSTVWEQLQEWSNAISDYDAILAINPAVHEAYYFRSKCYAMTNKDAAVRDCLSSLKGNLSHVPSLLLLYELLVENGNLATLFGHLEEMTKKCEEIYNFFSSEATEKEECFDVLRRFSQFETAFPFGKTKREREKERFSKMLHFLHLLRGQLRFVTADFSGARENFTSMKQHGIDDPDCFYAHCLDELEVDSLGKDTIALCQVMLQRCLTKRSLDNFVRLMELPTPESRVLRSPADQIFFLACFLFRRLHHIHHDDDTVLGFWRMLKKKDAAYGGLQFACSDPFILTTLFKAYVRYQFILTTTLLNTFQELFVTFAKDKASPIEAPESTLPFATGNFFIECRHLVLSVVARDNMEGVQ